MKILLRELNDLEVHTSSLLLHFQIKWNIYITKKYFEFPKFILHVSTHKAIGGSDHFQKPITIFRL